MTTIEPIAGADVQGLISELGLDKVSKHALDRFHNWIWLSSAIYKGMVDGRLLCVWGLIPPTMLSDQAYLWLQTSDTAQEHEFILVRRSQIELKVMLEKYSKIVGHCEVRAERSIRWLRWLGAIFGEPDGLLVPFVIRRA